MPPFSRGGRIENSFKSVIFGRRIQNWFKENREGCNDKTFTIAILGVQFHEKETSGVLFLRSSLT